MFFTQKAVFCAEIRADYRTYKLCESSLLQAEKGGDGFVKKPFLLVFIYNEHFARLINYIIIKSINYSNIENIGFIAFIIFM